MHTSGDLLAGQATTQGGHCMYRSHGRARIHPHTPPPPVRRETAGQEVHSERHGDRTPGTGRGQKYVLEGPRESVPSRMDNKVHGPVGADCMYSSCVWCVSWSFRIRIHQEHQEHQDTSGYVRILKIYRCILVGQSVSRPWSSADPVPSGYVEIREDTCILTKTSEIHQDTSGYAKDTL